MMIRIRKGLDLPIAGEPTQEIDTGPRISRVALLGSDYVGMKPTMAVEEGAHVQRGELLFTDKRIPAIRFTAPACGKVSAIHRGARRVFQSLVIEVAGEDAEVYDTFEVHDLPRLSRQQVGEQLLKSGLWTALRMRPFSKVPDPEQVPFAIFITAMDTQPLAARPEIVLAESPAEFNWGLQILRHLTSGKTYLCKAPGTEIPGTDLDFLTVVEFDGPHPAGLPGTHIHFLAPVNDKRQVWYIGYQDVVAIGKLFVKGELDNSRVIALSGPAIKRPHLVRTVLGASVEELVAGELKDGDQRLVSGSVLSGHTAAGPFAFLGRYHLQVCALEEGTQREFLGWQKPGFDKFSVTGAFASALIGAGRKFAMTTSQEGSPRAMVPIGSYERVLPFDLEPTYLLRALLVGDAEQARLLGCLELDEDDLALCSYVCPGKSEYGPLLRRLLTEIEKEG